MHSTTMMILIALAPAITEANFATQQAKPPALGRLSLPQVPPARMRLPPAYGFAPSFAPAFAPSFAEGDVKPAGFTSSYSSYSSYSAPSPPPSATMSSSGLSPEQVAFMQRQAQARGGGGFSASAPAPAPASSGSGEFAGMTQDQIDFIRRKRGEISMDGGLDTHGRPRSGGGGGGAAVAAAPVAVAAPAASPASGEFAGMTQDQIDFIRRKRGEIGMDGGLDTHGRPRGAHLDAQESPPVFGVLAASLLGFTFGAVIFSILRFRRSASDELREQFLSA